MTLTSNQSEPGFDQTKAELFEALGHPMRIRILQTLERAPMGFAELKKAVGVESSGHLSFHLGKLDGLQKVDQDGRYSLTDEGREALRVISATKEEGRGSFRAHAPHVVTKNVAIAALVIGMLLLGSFAVYQQQQVGSLSRTIASQQVGSVVINGTRYSYLDIPLQALNLPTTIQFNGVSFNLTSLPFATGSYATISIQQAGNQTGQPVTVRIVSMGTNVQVKFSDGATESFIVANTMTNGSQIVVYNLTPATNLWFTHHTGPRAGVFWNPTADSVELLVSLGR